MKYAFQNYIFDETKLSLVKDELDQDISFHDAKLLQLLIESPDQIFSKDEILKNVWKDQVVSEQSVFQSISHLRGLFGSASIKTFPRKGYQWQLPIERLTPCASGITQQHKKSLINIRTVTTAVVTLILLLALSLGLQHSQTKVQHAPISVGIIPFVMAVPTSNRDITDNAFHAVYEALDASEAIHIEKTAYQYNYTDIAHKTVAIKKTLFENDAAPDFYFQLFLSDTSNSIHTHYRLLSRHRVWTGDFETKNVNDLARDITLHFEKLMTSKLANLQDQNIRAVRSDYLLLHELYPEDLIILHNLLAYLVDRGNFDRARIYADTLIENAKRIENPLHIAKGNIQLARILIEENKISEAKLTLENAIATFKNIQNLRYQIEAFEVFAHLYDMQQLFTETQEQIYRAIDASNLSNNHLRTAHLYIGLAIVAKKYRLLDEKDNALHQALLTLDKNNASPEHYAAVYYQMAHLSDDEDFAEKYYQRTLAVFQNDFNWWEKFAAQKGLAEIYIRNNRWEDAIGLFNEEDPLPIAALPTLASIYIAWGKHGQAVPYAEEAFKHANLDENNDMALKTAYLLLAIHKALGHNAKEAYYRSFIKSHTTR